MSVIERVNKPHRAKHGKKNRKHGRGTRKVTKSRFHSYAGLIGASEERKHLRMLSRKARFVRRAAARGGFSSARAYRRNLIFGPPHQEGVNESR
jgi:hypothetical protein